ncbi:monocarboxylate transporter 2-like isoform X2 [Danaus plexippus]|nr:monocarboxylate transporter 2-like isoform X2 [Danaus plexippus]
MIYKDLLIKLNMDSTSITLLNGISATCMSLSGFLTSPMLKFLSIRQLGLVAAVIFNLGMLGMVFVSSKITFYVCFGILQSLGNGIIFNLSCTVLNNYFVKKRLLAISFTQTIIAISGLVVPQFLNWSFDAYGQRGTLLLVSGICIHNIFGIILMQPIAWHLKQVEVPETEKDTFETKSFLTKEHQISNKENSKQKSNDAGEVVISEKYNLEEGTIYSSQSRSILSNFVDFKVYRSFLLSNAYLGMGLCTFSEFTFTIMLPQALYSMGWDETNVAWALSLMATGDCASRFLLIFLSGWLANFGSHEIYVVGLIIGFITKIGMLWSENTTSIFIFLTIMGVSRCLILVFMPLVIAEAVKPDLFTGALGLELTIVGIFSLVLGPVIGAIRDLTDSYATAFYILTSCLGVIIVSWSIEILYKKNKHKRQT